MLTGKGEAESLYTSLKEANRKESIILETTLTEVLGSGAFGTVYKAHLRAEPERAVAVKVI